VRRDAGGIERQAPGDEPVEHDSERIDVGACADRVTAELLGTCVVGSHQSHPRLVCAGDRSDDLGDAEVEQLGLALMGYENISRLDVTMHDEVLVCVLHGVADSHEQHQPFVDRQAPAIAVTVDGRAVDELDHQIGYAVIRPTAVVEPGDLVMLERRENSTLMTEALEHGGIRRVGGGEVGARRVFLVADGAHTEFASVFAQRAVSQFKSGGPSGGRSMLTSLAGQALHFAALGAGPAGMAAVGGLSMVSRFMPSPRPSGPTMTYAWGLPGSHSERVLGAIPPSFEFTYKDIPGIDPDAYEPVLLKFVLTKDNYRLIGATRQQLNRESMMNGGLSAGDWVAEDRLHVQLQKSNRGECTLHVLQALEPGEYGVVLRPVNGYNSHPSGFGGAEQLSAMVWDFGIRGATTDDPASKHK
jgi:hypothetical protein